MRKPRKETRDPYQDRIRKLELLLEFGKKITAEKNLDRLLNLLACEAKAILAADRCSVFLLNRDKDILRAKIAHGTKEPIEIPSLSGIAGETVRCGEMLNIPNAYADPHFSSDMDRKTGYHTRSLLSAPIKNAKDQTIGVFQALNKLSESPFDPEDEQILTMIASQAAVALENAQLYEQVSLASQDTIFRLAAAAEYKDGDTGFHIIRMSRYSQLIAQALGFPEEYCEKIRLASPMHDIGKLGVPDAILLKPAKLDEKEWAEIKKHPLYGAQILKDSSNELIQISQKIALTHHEKYDGSGYPNGLKGEDIPIEGRIVAVADVFDALTSKRVYKDKFPLEESLKIIREGKGSHFDPKVVLAFESALPQIIQVMKQYSNAKLQKPSENNDK